MKRAEARRTVPHGGTATCALGVEIDGGGFVRIIEEGAPLPASGWRLFTTVSDFQTAVDVHLQCARGRKMISVGRFLLSGIRKGRKGEPRIEIVIDVDADGLIRASARDGDTEAAMESVFPPSALFTGDEGENGGADAVSAGVFSLIRRARQESSLVSKRAHAGLLAEIEDLITQNYAALASKNERRIVECRTALETLLVEIRAVQKSAASGARRGVRHD
jgi:molecular chaperone DnaK (HSP70)